MSGYSPGLISSETKDWRRPIAVFGVQLFMANICPVCGQIGVLHGTMPRLLTGTLGANRLTLKGKMSYEPYKFHEMACYGAIFHLIVVS